VRQDTIDAIVDASTLPLSIIIVGVGNEDFRYLSRDPSSTLVFALSPTDSSLLHLSQMDVLDADEEPLRSGSRYADRDIVQVRRSSPSPLPQPCGE
jgi:hypothetical protein